MTLKNIGCAAANREPWARKEKLKKVLITVNHIIERKTFIFLR